MWWRALGLEPSDDKETVKKAYAALIKTIDQDKDIEEFTKVHGAYRMAMKSFKKVEKSAAKGLIAYEADEHWYILELAKIYNNPKRRLNVNDWKNLFACMSFIEEKHFLTQYVLFFNEHYALTDSIWHLVEQYYPLSSRQDFRWPELVRGHMSVSDHEIEGLRFEQASAYVTYKIHAFYAILDGDYQRALTFVQILLKDYKTEDLLRWHLLCTIELHLDDTVKEAYEAYKQRQDAPYMPHYLYGGYLMCQKSYEKAKEVLGCIAEVEVDGRIRDMIRECDTRSIDKQEVNALNKLPWLELGAISVKGQKLLLKGDYGKAVANDGSSKFRLWGRR